MRNVLFFTLLLVSFFVLAGEEEPGETRFRPRINPNLMKFNKKLPSLPSAEKSAKEEEKKEEQPPAQENQEDQKEEEKPAENAPEPLSAGSSSGSKIPGTSNKSTGAVRDEKAKETIVIESNHTKRLKPNAKIYLDFNQTELMDVIKFFSEKTGRNFILQDKLKKDKVTVMSPNPVTLSEAYKAFLTMLSVNGVTITDDGKFTLIMSEKDILNTKVTVAKADQLTDTFKMVATILKFKYLPASEAEKVIKIFKDNGGRTLVFNDSTIIVVDYEANIKRIMELLRDLDQPTSADTARLHFVKVKNIMPADAKKLIDDIFKDYTKANSKKGGKDNTPVLSGVAGSKNQKDGKASAADAPGDDDYFSLESVYLQIVADDRGEQLIVLCNNETFNLILQIIKKIDTDVEGEGEIHVVKLQNAKAKDVVTTLNQVSKNKKSSNARGAQKGNEVFEGEVNISENESTNSLVIVSSLRDFKSLRKVIEQLDIKRKQVFVEAAILEINISDNLEYGNAYAGGGFEVDLFGSKVPVFFGKALSTATPGLVAGMIGPALEGTASLPGALPGIGIPSLGILLNAMKNDANVNVVSTPHLLTTDNEEAEITVGEVIPFPTGNIVSSTVGNQTSYKREDVALKLKIKPQINESGYMSLDVTQELTELGQNTPYGYATTKRSAKTIVNAEDEQTIVIGGLIKDYVSESEDKVPVLGDIPVIGSFFKYKKNSKKKVNLLLILTPHIVESKEDFDRIVKRKMQEREEFARKFYGTISDYQASITMAKKKGALLSMALALEKAKENEKEEMEERKKTNIDAVMVLPDGTHENIEIKSGKEVEHFPVNYNNENDTSSPDSPSSDNVQSSQEHEGTPAPDEFSKEDDVIREEQTQPAEQGDSE